MITGQAPRSTFLLLILSLFAAQASAEWLEGGVRVTGPGLHAELVAVPDGAGGSIIAWQDGTWSYLNSDIYAQHLRIDGSLDPRWPSPALSICTASGRQMEPSAIADESGGAIVAWMDGRNTDPLAGESLYAVYAQRVMADGSIAAGWPQDGVAVCPDSCTAVPPGMAPDGQGGVFVAWSAGRLEEADVYVQHITAEGTLAAGWPSTGFVVSNAPSEQWVRKAVPDGSGGVYLVWDDYRDNGPDVYCLHLTSSGTAVPGWPTNGLLVSGQPHQTSIPAGATMCPDGHGGVLVFWSEYSHVTGYYTSFRSKRINADASLAPGWPEGGVILSEIWASTVPQCVPDDQGGALVVWLVFYGEETRIYAHRVLAEGLPAAGWPPGGLLLSSGLDFKTDPQIASDGEGGAYVAWSDFRSGSPPPIDVFAQHLSSAGTIMAGWPEAGLSLSLGFRFQSVSPAIVATESGAAIVAWLGGGGGVDEILAGKLIGAGSETFSYALRRAESEPDFVRLTWMASATSDAAVTVYRRLTAGSWAPVSTELPDGLGQIVYEDHDVAPGSQYEYRLGVVLAGGEYLFGEVSVAVPLFRLSMLPIRPNPTRGDLKLSITLPSQEPAMLQLFTVGGQLVHSAEVGSMGPGRHEIRLATGTRVASGIYIARLRQGGRSISTRIALIR